MLLEKLRAYVATTDGQEEILNFIEELRLEVGSRETWIENCKKSEDEFKQNSWNDETLSTIVNHFQSFVDNLPPGHDKGHFYRDILNAIIISDSLKQKVASNCELAVGLLAGAFHDIGNSITERYLDKVNAAGHAEVSAWLFYRHSSELLGESTRMLVAYAIAAHTHYLKPVEVKFPKPGVKQPYWDDLWMEDDKMWGAAIRIARMSDRIDTNGPSTLLFRHILAQLDSEQNGGANISGNDWVVINEESISQMLKPVFRNPIPNPPSVLEHVKRFANSNFGQSPYSIDDYLFPRFEELLKLKLLSMNGVEMFTNPQYPDFYPGKVHLEHIKYLFKWISQSNCEMFDKVWKNFEAYWNKLTDEDQKIWINIYYYLEENYGYLLSVYQYMTYNSEFKNSAQVILSLLRNK